MALGMLPWVLAELDPAELDAAEVDADDLDPVDLNPADLDAAEVDAAELAVKAREGAFVEILGMAHSQLLQGVLHAFSAVPAAVVAAAETEALYAASSAAL